MRQNIQKTAGPVDAAHWNRIGVERRGHGDLPGALAALDTAVALAPRVAELHLNRAAVLMDLGRRDEAATALRGAVSLDARLSVARVALGQLALVSMKIDEAVTEFEAALAIDPESVPAHLGLYEALQVRGERERAVVHQRRALAHQRLFAEKAPAPGAPTILMLSVPGDWQANVPLEFMYPMMPIGVQKLYVDGATPPSGSLPEADLVFNAVAQSDAADATLAMLEQWIPRIGLPSLNDPARVRLLTRDGVARDYGDIPGALVVPSRRIARADLAADALVAGVSAAAPAMLRPIDSQAGKEFARIESAAEFDAYLASTTAEQFYIAPFVNYGSADGYYRKYRIIFVDGKAFPQHLAISDHWMVHYYNARNADEAWIRSEEEAFMADIGSVFDGPRAAVLDEIAKRAGLEYFGMDCGVLPDGRVVIFEIDVAMIVHLGDSIEEYPYKHKYVPRIIAALEQLIRERARRR